jgi:hypothetical protein
MSWFVPLGAIAAIAGVAVVVRAIRGRGDGDDPRNHAMMIGGTMLTAFGVVIAGFALADNSAAPLDHNAADVQGRASSHSPPC